MLTCDFGDPPCRRWSGHIGDHAPWYGLCDVGGCGNGAIGEEVAVLVPETGDYLEVSLCGDHPELTHLIRADSGEVVG